MRSIAILAAAAMLIGGSGVSLAQETGETPPDTDESAQTQETDAEREPEPRPGVSQGAFTPSEEVKADTAVAFPTDI